MKDTLSHCTWPKALPPACLAFLLVISAALMGSWLLVWGTGYAMAASFTGKELLLNGGFDQGGRAWVMVGTGSGVRENAGQDGGPALELRSIWDLDPPDSYAIQTLHLPTRMNGGTYSLDYRLERIENGYAGIFFLYLYKGTSLETMQLLDQLYTSDWVTATTEWQTINGSLTAEQVQAVQAAHDAGEQVWLVVYLNQAASPEQFAANQFKVFLDNVSLRVSGSMTYPTGHGPIAFFGEEEGFRHTVNRMEIDGSGRQTVWTHPAQDSTKAMYDLAWKPDGSEIAFASNHESAYSAFNSDVYGIHPSGTGLRRITNPPSRAELDAGSYPTGTLTGRIENNYGNVINFLVYVEGASEPVGVDIGPYQQSTGFSIPNVAYLGAEPGYLVMMWSGINCSYGREFAHTGVPVTPEEVTDIGTIVFNGRCGAYNSSHITWKGNGTELGVDVITPKRFAATGEAIGRDLFEATLTADKPAWSPIDDTLLYFETSSAVPNGSGIYRTTVGGGAGNRIVPTLATSFVAMAWLPDGSGFVYTVDNELRQFLFDGNQDTLLTMLFQEYARSPSVSGDGAYVVFQRQNRSDATINDIWALQRNKPNQLWAVTSDGKSSNPDWARTTPPSGYTVTYDANNATSGDVPANQTKIHGVDLILATNSSNLTRTGHVFASWNTAADGSGTDYAEGATYTTDAGVTLYARWTTQPTYTVTYDANNATSGEAPNAQTKTHGVNLTLATNSGNLTRTGHAFAGWNTAADGSGTDYAEGATYTADAGVTLYARWTTQQTYTVIYDANNATSGEAPNAQTKIHGVDLTLATNSGNLARTGHAFAGWNTAADGSGTDYVEGATYTANAGVTLYARWTAAVFALNVRATGASGVPITASPEEYGGSTDYAKTGIPGGTWIILTALETVGNAGFRGWNGCDTTNPETRTCTVTMNAERTVTASYGDDTTKILPGVLMLLLDE